MPYHIEKQGDEFAVVEDSGKVVGKHPTRQQAIDQQRALYANVPDATGKASAEINDLPDSAFLHVEAGGKKDDTGKTEPRSLRHLPYKTAEGGIDLPKLRNALSRLGQSDTGTSGGDTWLTDSLRNSLRTKAEKILKDNTDAESAKKERRNILQTIMDVLIGVTAKEESLNQFQNRVYGSFNKKFSSPISPGDPSIIGYVASPSIWIMDVYPDHVIVSYGDDYYSVPITDDGSTISFAIQPEWTKVKSKQEWVEKAAKLKEGRRNSTGDAANLQQIHDLSVMNGATCPMVFKEANGKLRWVMLSSNSYQDTDKEIIAQAALEADVERADKEKSYGPLRWWHVGDPDPIMRTPGRGIDIGDCDFNAMQDRILIESGTFRDERIGEAIKEHADTLAGSIGFFHPLNQPDNEGVFTDIQRFERSLLPRAKASNQLTALTVTKESQDMATMKEKFDEFVGLLGGDSKLAESVVKQAEATQKAAQDAGLKFKEQQAVASDKATDMLKCPECGKDVPAGDKKCPNCGADMTAAKKENAADADMDEAQVGKMLKAFGPHIDKMIDAKMNAAKKEREAADAKAAEKEAGLTAKITTLETKLKEVEAVAKTLAGDLPRGVKDGYRASQAASTITTKDAPAAPAPDPLADFYNWAVEVSHNAPPTTQPVQPPGA